MQCLSCFFFFLPVNECLINVCVFVVMPKCVSLHVFQFVHFFSTVRELMYAKPLMLRSCSHAHSSDSPGQLMGVTVMRVWKGTHARMQYIHTVGMPHKWPTRSECLVPQGSSKKLSEEVSHQQEFS